MISPRHARTVRSPRGTTLLEAVVALAILLVGIAGTMQLQVLGITANAGGRTATHAYQLARELTQALTQLAPGDPLLAADFVSDAPPAQFGRLLINSATIAPVAYKTWDDALPLVGITSNAQVYRIHGPDPEHPSNPLYQRYWQVWQIPTALGGGGGINVVAVSVIYREPRLPGLKEVVLLTQVTNPGLAAASLAAYR